MIPLGKFRGPVSHRLSVLLRYPGGFYVVVMVSTFGANFHRISGR